MLNTLKELSKYLEELDKNENTTPVRLRSILKSVDSINICAYVQSFAMIICNQLFKSNNIFGEIICRDFIQSEIKRFSNLKQNGLISYPDLLSLTKKCLFEYVKTRLELYNESEEMTKLNKSSLHHVHYKAIANKRTKQEDRYFGVSNAINYSCSHKCYKKENCIVHRPSDSDNVLFIGMLDGHNGPEASEHCHHLAPYFVSNHLQYSICTKGEYNLVETLGETYYWLNNTLNGCRNKYRWKAGTTSTMCLIDHDFIYTSWVGDCSAWLIHKDDAQVPLTDVLHRPSQSSEVVDVWNNGGIVTRSGAEYDRVNGILAVTRALGDDRKIVGVSALPSVSEYKIGGSELCLVLATDGLWDCFDCSGPSIGALCRAFFAEHPRDDASSVDTLCQSIVDRAVRSGASDNISVIVVVFGDGADARPNVSRSEHLQHSRAVRWPRDRRRSCFVEEAESLRQCTPRFDEYLRSHFSHDVRMHPLLQETQRLATAHRRPRRARSLSQDIDKRFSSPIRWIDK